MQTPEICLEAVKQNWKALQYAKEQTLEVCLEALKQSYGRALRYIDNQTPEICIAAVQQNGWILEYVREQTPEICVEAIKREPEAYKYVRLPETEPEREKFIRKLSFLLLSL